ncbi:hypothetical protein AVEN_222203-1 [Araneus ventricosus]|uniref:Uncharacterized protein n=1 Tax=Araneus ventricosus TaxID=182803 RepID=A0A4Y2SR16_ARAVE|nr:hypothetical protein AVEN_222203-1 [Araneus ventricosus]
MGLGYRPILFHSFRKAYYRERDLFSLPHFLGAQTVFCLRGPLAIGQAGNLASPPLLSALGLVLLRVINWVVVVLLHHLDKLKRASKIYTGFDISDSRRTFSMRCSHVLPGTAGLVCGSMSPIALSLFADRRERSVASSSSSITTVRLENALKI